MSSPWEVPTTSSVPFSHSPQASSQCSLAAFDILKLKKFQFIFLMSTSSMDPSSGSRSTSNHPLLSLANDTLNFIHPINSKSQEVSPIVELPPWLEPLPFEKQIQQRETPNSSVYSDLEGPPMQERDSALARALASARKLSDELERRRQKNTEAARRSRQVSVHVSPDLIIGNQFRV